MSTAFENFVYIIEIIVLAVLFVPTLIAFFTGAPWVPTPQARVKRMLELAKIKKGDRIYDLGCGDGRIPQHAAKEFGADAVGLELSPLIYFLARARNILLRSKATILLRDFRRIHYGNAAALTFYLLPETLSMLRPKLEMELKPGTRVVSYAFEIAGWKPTYVEPRDREKHYGPIFVYEIPKSMNANGAEAKK